MLALNPKPALQKVTPNILPCSIKQNGPISIEKRYWSPTPSTSSSDETTSTSYFRGRKLLGKSVKLPDGYQGVVLSRTDNPLGPSPPKAPTVEELRRMEEGDDEDEMDVQTEKDVDVKTMEQMYNFDEMVVWGHEMLPEEDDVYVRSVREWVGFAEAIHSHDDDTTTP